MNVKINAKIDLNFKIDLDEETELIEENYKYMDLCISEIVKNFG